LCPREGFCWPTLRGVRGLSAVFTRFLQRRRCGPGKGGSDHVPGAAPACFFHQFGQRLGALRPQQRGVVGDGQRHQREDALAAVGPLHRLPQVHERVWRNALAGLSVLLRSGHQDVQRTPWSGLSIAASRCSCTPILSKGYGLALGRTVAMLGLTFGGHQIRTRPPPGDNHRAAPQCRRQHAERDCASQPRIPRGDRLRASPDANSHVRGAHLATRPPIE